MAAPCTTDGTTKRRRGTDRGVAFSGGQMVVARMIAVMYAAVLLAAGSEAEVTYAVLHEFGKSGDGAYPSSPLAMGSDGVLYGATNEGGTGICSGQTGCGVVYSLTPPGTGGGKWTEAVLYSFQGGDDGGLPSGVTVASNRTLYGTTAYGGGGSCS